MPSFYAKRRIFVLAALVLAGLARPACGADLSDAEHYVPSRLRGRRHCRCRRASRGTEAHGAPGAHGGGGKSRRCRRQSRGEVRQRRGARRLHHSRDDHRAGGQRDRHEEQGLLGRRSAPGRDRGVQSGCARDPSQQSGEGPARVHPERQDEGLHLWQRRRWDRVRISARSISSARSRKCKPCMCRSPAAGRR